MEYVYDYSRLIGRIFEKLGSKFKYIQQMGFSEPTGYGKLKGEKEFTQSEISKSCEILDIPEEEIPVFFFKRVLRKLNEAD